jgi:hypothetical protein
MNLVRQGAAVQIAQIRPRLRRFKGVLFFEPGAMFAQKLPVCVRRGGLAPPFGSKFVASS